MAILWLDADVFIQAKNGPYKFKRIPQFWEFLSEQFELGTIRCPKIVYDEISEGTDDLARWFVERVENGACIPAGESVQDHYRRISDYVYQKYTPHQAGAFLKGGDGWVIAHALDSRGMVVTQESDRSKKSKVKVPTICKGPFKAPCLDIYQMLELLDFDLSKE